MSKKDTLKDGGKITDLDEIVEDHASINVVDDSCHPTIDIIGCGGAGTSILNRFVSHSSHPYEDVNHRVLDTSLSNFAGLHPGIERITTSVITGSGKIRRENIDPIRAKLRDSDLVTDAAQVTFVVFAMGGGSGSVIGPLLAAELVEAGKAVVLFAVADNTSGKDNENTINTLRTLQSLSEDDLYFPLFLFSNDKANSDQADRDLALRMENMLEFLLSGQVHRLDLSDKLNMLNPYRIDCGAPGCWSCIIDIDTRMNENDPIDWTFAPTEVAPAITEASTFHSHASVNTHGGNHKITSLVRYPGESRAFTLNVACGLPINEKFLRELNRSAEQYATAKANIAKPADPFKNVPGTKSGKVFL